MSLNYVSLNNGAYQCILNSFLEADVLRQLRLETAEKFPQRCHIQISPDQAQFFQILIKLTRAKNILEIGTFSGYSSLAMALALPVDGKIITCDINKVTAELAQRYWQLAGLSKKINLKLAPATLTLTQLIATNHAFDLIFIDANEDEYDIYFEAALKLSSPGTLILVDNVLALNGVLHTESSEDRAKTMLAFNQKVANDNRVISSIVPIGGGIMMSWVK